jgi:hypothetical protein
MAHRDSHVAAEHSGYLIGYLEQVLAILARLGQLE